MTFYDTEMNGHGFRGVYPEDVINTEMKKMIFN